MAMKKNYQNRPLVKKFLPLWVEYLEKHGPEHTLEIIKTKQTKFIGHKDRMGLIQALGLDEEK